MTRQHLIIDADDTLWENNIFFEQAFDEFVDFLDHSHLTPPQVRDVLDSIEAVNAKIHGYGSKNFGRKIMPDVAKILSLSNPIARACSTALGVPHTMYCLGCFSIQKCGGQSAMSVITVTYGVAGFAFCNA